MRRRWWPACRRGPAPGGRHRQQGVSEPVGGPGGVRGEVGVSAVEDPQPHQQLVAGGRPAQAVGVAPGVVGEHRGVFGVGLGRPGVKVRGASHRQARHIGHRNLSASGRLQQQRRRRAGRVDHQSDRRAPPRRRSGARSTPRRCARCAPAPRRRPMPQRRRSGRLWRCRRRRTPRCRRSRVLAWRNSLGPGTFLLGCSRRLRLNHFTSSPIGHVPVRGPRHPTAFICDNTPPLAINVTGGYSPTRRGEQPAPTLPRQSRSTR